MRRQQASRRVVQRGVSARTYRWLREHGRRPDHCYWCGHPVSRREASRDHVIPLAHGGPDVPANIVLAHVRCNGAKADAIDLVGIVGRIEEIERLLAQRRLPAGWYEGLRLMDGWVYEWQRGRGRAER